VKYNNKKVERLKGRLENSISTDRIVSANKMKPMKSSLRSAKMNIGKIVNKTNEYDKTQEKIEDKEVENNNNGKSIKVFNKGNMTYIKYKNNDLPVSKFMSMANQDGDVKSFLNNMNKEKMKQNFNGSLSEFLTKQYS
jgi:hypothetical protein